MVLLWSASAVSAEGPAGQWKRSGDSAALELSLPSVTAEAPRSGGKWAIKPLSDLLITTPTSHTFPHTAVGSSSLRISTVSETTSTPVGIDGVDESCASFSRDVELIYEIDGIEVSRQAAVFPVTVFRIVDAELGTVERQYLEVQMYFTPVAAGPAPTCTVTVDRASGTDRAITLDGVGLAPVMATDPSSMNFGDQAVGTQSDPQELTVANLGNIPLLFSVTLQGDDALDFQISCAAPPCPSSVPGGESAVRLIRFAPGGIGERTAEIFVSSNDPLNPDDTISLSGFGILDPIFLDGFESSDSSGWNGGCVGCLP